MRFAAFLQYRPRSDDEASRRSQRIRDAVKSDGFILLRTGSGQIEQRRAINYYVQTIARRISEFPFLQNYLGPGVILVPVPRSSPMREKAALWPARRICEELVNAGLGSAVVPMLERVDAVQKSAFAGPGMRPKPDAHRRSTRVDSEQDLETQKAENITLVDDFVTRGSTFLGMQPLVAYAFPLHTVRCFALIRTESYNPISEVLHPVEGTLSEDIFGNPSCTV
jgi:hypothetical protein